MLEVRKFIINDNELILGVVQLHEDLLGKSRERGKTIGGGRWEWNRDKYGDRIFFYGKSFDFGSVTKEQLMSAWDNSYKSARIENCEICFSIFETIEEVLKEYNVNIIA
jgi:hypothetical protein